MMVVMPAGCGGLARGSKGFAMAGAGARRQRRACRSARGATIFAGAIDDVGGLRARRRHRYRACCRGSCRRRSRRPRGPSKSREGSIRRGVGEQDRAAVGQHDVTRFGRFAGERFEHRHPHRHSHFHLFRGSATVLRQPRSSRSRRRGSSARDASPAHRAWRRRASFWSRPK